MPLTESIQLLTSSHSPAIRSWGVSAERFPRYVLREPKPHGHDIVEFFFVLGGNGIHCIGQERRELRPGDMGVVTLGQSHCIITPDGPMDILNIYLDPARFHRAGLSPGIRQLLDALLPEDENHKPPTPEQSTWSVGPGSPIHGLINAIERESSLRTPGFEEAIEMYARLLLLECARHCILGPQGDDAPVCHPSVERVRTWLDEHWAEPVDLEKLAAHARVSKSHLCRLFQKQLGTTIISYVHNLRVQQAMRLLQEKDTKVISIAHEVGFGDLANFNRVFRRISGLTPTDFRREARNRGSYPLNAMKSTRTDTPPEVQP